MVIILHGLDIILHGWTEVEFCAWSTIQQETVYNIAELSQFPIKQMT